MSSYYRWDELNLVARNSIYVQPDEDRKGHKRCGCFSYVPVRAGVALWDLCQYHEGMNDGADDVEAEVERLTAELAEMRGYEIPIRDARIDELSDIEKALRAITGQMSSHPRAWDGWSSACAEWDIRAAGVV